MFASSDDGVELNDPTSLVIATLPVDLRRGPYDGTVAYLSAISLTTLPFHAGNELIDVGTAISELGSFSTTQLGPVRRVLPFAAVLVALPLGVARGV